MTRLPDPVVCLVTDRRRLAAGANDENDITALERFLAEAIDSGIDLIQVREPDLDAGLLIRAVRHAVNLARGTSVRILVNDRADVALAAGTDGVHLRAGGPCAARVRTLSPDWIIGRSSHSDVLGSPDQDADYLLFGTVFPTLSKPGVHAVGLAPLAAFATSSVRPVLAIGGVTPDRARECRRAGASGIAAIGAFLPEGSVPGALGVHSAVRAFREAMA